MFSFSCRFSLPLENYKNLLEINKKRWNFSFSRTDSVFAFDCSIKPFRDSYSNTVFYLSIGLLTFDIDFSICDWSN